MRVLLLTATLALAACNASDVAPEARPPRGLMIGDSQESQYSTPVIKRLRGKVTMFDAPGNARTTGYTIEHLEEWLAQDFDIITWNNGLHDLCHLDGDMSGPRKTEPEQYRENLRFIGRRLKETGARVVFFTTTPVPRLAHCRDPGDVALYNAIAREVMAELKIPVKDLGAFAGKHMDLLRDAELESDVHFTEEGYEIIADWVAKVIRHELEIK